MPYVAVPRDLFSIKTKFMFNLTKRQVYCFGAGGGVGLLVHFTLQKANIDSSLSSLLMMAVMTPFFLLALYEKNGKTFEVMLKEIITFNMFVDNIRPYRTKNIYTLLDEQDKINKELALIGRTKKPKTKQTNKTSEEKVDERGKGTTQENSSQEKQE